MNNLTEAVIVLTEAEEQEFARRFKENMPKTFSGIIFHTADAFEKFIKRDDVEVNMDSFHRVKLTEEKDPVCVACLAGAAMIDLCGATGFEVCKDEYMEDDTNSLGAFSYSAISKEMGCYEEVVDSIRATSFRFAFNNFIRYFRGSGPLSEDSSLSKNLENLGARFWEATREECMDEYTPEYIACLRHSAEEVKALGL